MFAVARSKYPAVAFSIPPSLRSLRAGRSTLSALRKSEVRAEAGTPGFAPAASPLHVVESSRCFVCAAEQSVRFSPAFTFPNLARGPPG
jgi:hypothetical protein